MISILVTDAHPLKDARDEKFASTQLAGNLQIVGLRTARFAVFVVSDLSERENSDFAENLLPAVRQHLERARGLNVFL